MANLCNTRHIINILKIIVCIVKNNGKENFTLKKKIFFQYICIYSKYKVLLTFRVRRNVNFKRFLKKYL